MLVMLRDGQVPAVRVGGLLRVRESDLDAWISGLAVAAPAHEGVP